MNTSKRSSTTRYKSRAFTLIEVLVVVAIIALLVSVLMPAMKSAKESAKATVCLSNLKQQGTGFAGYAKDSKQYLPFGGKFRYILIDGGRRNTLWVDNERWNRQGNGMLFPRYTGNSADLFYCPSNTGADADAPVRGKKKFLQLYNKPTSPPPYGNDPEAPIGAYAYGLPLAMGKSPRDGVKYFYPDECMEEVQNDPNDNNQSRMLPYSPPQYSAYYSYLWDPDIYNNPDMKNWLSPIAYHRTPQNPNGPRGAYPTQALLTDSYVGGYEGYHVNGWNVLFSDFHAKRVGDPSRKIREIGSSYVYPGQNGPTLGRSPNGKGAAAWVVWDHFSRNP